jgi:hypothetical protein
MRLRVFLVFGIRLEPSLPARRAAARRLSDGGCSRREGSAARRLAPARRWDPPLPPLLPRRSPNGAGEERRTGVPERASRALATAAAAFPERACGAALAAAPARGWMGRAGRGRGEPPSLLLPPPAAAAGDTCAQDLFPILLDLCRTFCGEAPSPCDNSTHRLRQAALAATAAFAPARAPRPMRKRDRTFHGCASRSGSCSGGEAQTLPPALMRCQRRCSNAMECSRRRNRCSVAQAPGTNPLLFPAAYECT